MRAAIALGVGLTASCYAPKMEPSVEGCDFVEVAAGGNFTCALRATGEIACWGDNDAGQLGTAPDPPHPYPQLVPGLPAATGLAAGGGFACAVTVDESVWCWGENDERQIGSTATTHGPNQVDLAGGVAVLTVGHNHACALLRSGNVACWGGNSLGQLGTDLSATLTSAVPIEVIGGASDLSARNDTTCALVNGNAWCWGANDQLQLGTGTTAAASTSPVQVVGANGISVRVGGHHVCVRRLDGGADCWGANEFGQLARGTQSGTPTPVPGVARFVDATDVTLGHAFTCALDGDGRALCAGFNSHGQLGDGTVEDHSTPVPVAAPQLETFAGIDAAAVFETGLGGEHACGVTVEGDVRCWGANQAGQLGDGTLLDKSVPTPVAPILPCPD